MFHVQPPTYRPGDRVSMTFYGVYHEGTVVDSSNIVFGIKWDRGGYARFTHSAEPEGLRKVGQSHGS